MKLELALQTVKKKNNLKYLGIPMFIAELNA